MSGGQRQRVALGRAIVRDPAVFLFDEPLSNLDAKLRVQTRAEISKLHMRLGTTFIYVTHDQVEAMTMATRIVVMNNGAIQQVGEPQELYDRPRNLFVAGFIGSPAMNFFDGTVVREDGALAIDTGGFKLPVAKEKEAQLSAYAGKKIVLGIRPENIHAAEFTPSGIQAHPLEADVDVTESMGNEVIIYLAARRASSSSPASIPAPTRARARRSRWRWTSSASTCSTPRPARASASRRRRRKRSARKRRTAK